MTLVLEVEFLSGVVFAARGQESPEPDWPPQPDRVFSALVATWGMRGLRDEEGSALKWLETRSAPAVRASEAVPRTSALRFVPPNDPKSGRTGNREILPALRRRQPRLFPATRPEIPVVWFYWPDAEPEPGTLSSLQRLASDTAYVGHSASLTRCRFNLSSEPAPAEAQPPRRWVYKGRFQELCENFAENRRPSPGMRLAPAPAVADASPRSYFSSDWMILEHVDGVMPDVRAAALVAKEIRNTILAGYKMNGLEDRIPEVVSGHTLDGSPTPAPHLAIVPLAFAGTSAYADGHVLGFALVPPRESDAEHSLWRNAEFLQAMRKIAPVSRETGRRELHWHEGREAMRLRSFELMLSPTLEPVKKSLSPGFYTAKARTYATVTPVVLDKHLKGKKPEERQQEIEIQIKAACRNIGLPEPARVVPDKHSSIAGAPSAQPSGRSPDWTRWRVPQSLASRPLTHAVIQFAEAVDGPLILGAGRFVGLGLCMAIDSKETKA
jgi:CRISPR-associated protein Csb2